MFSIAVSCLVIESIALIAVCIVRPLTNQVAYSLIYLVLVVFFSVAFLIIAWLNMWKVCRSCSRCTNSSKRTVYSSCSTHQHIFVYFRLLSRPAALPACGGAHQANAVHGRCADEKIAGASGSIRSFNAHCRPVFF